MSTLGPLAETVYRLVCWQRYSFEEAYDIAVIDGLFDGSPGEFLKITDPVRKAPCRENPSFVSVSDSLADTAICAVDPAANPLEAWR